MVNEKQRTEKNHRYKTYHHCGGGTNGLTRCWENSKTWGAPRTS